MPSPESGEALDWRQASRLQCALGLSAALWLLLAGHPAEMLERRWLDQALRWRAALGWVPPVDARVLILGLDDEDFVAMRTAEDEYRAVADGLRIASDLGAAVIALDVIYARLPAGAEESLAQIETLGTPVVWAEALRQTPGAGGEVQRLRSLPTRARLQPAGLINIAADADGRHRTYSLLHGAGSGDEPSLALAAWAAVRGLNWASDIVRVRQGHIEWQELAADGQTVKTRSLSESAGRPRFLNFRTPWREGAGFGHLTLRRLRQLHAAETPHGGQPLAGRIVFVANVATGIADVGPTAFGSNEPLVLLHATALNDLLQGSFLRRAPAWVDAIACLIVPLLGLTLIPTRRKVGLVGFWLLGTVLILGCGLFLLRGGWLVGTVGLGGLWTMIVVLEIGRRHTRELAARQRLRATMGLYFSPRVLADVLANPGQLEPRRANLAVLLSDLRNSTPLGERLGTDGVLDLLNKVFSIENRAVFAEDGSMEKPVGDQFLAYWGAPDPQPDAADRALRAARMVIAGLQALPDRLTPAAGALFGYGVALHWGPALLANIGSEQFFHYGPVGDLLNATARVESLTKLYGVRLLVTRDFLEQLTCPEPARVIDRVIVKGKSNPLELCEVTHAANSAAFSTVMVEYTKAFALYQAGDFTEAAALFEKLPDDAPSRLLAARCTAFRLTPPPGEWNGVYAMESK